MKAIEDIDDENFPLIESIESRETDQTLDVQLWIDYTMARENYLLPEDKEEATIPKNLSPKAIANAIYKRKYPSIVTFYTEMYADFPLLISAELIKRRKILGGRMLRPKYLADLIHIYHSIATNRYRQGQLCPYYGPLAVSMCVAYGYVELAIELANKYPVLLNKKRQPSSLTLFLQLISKCSMEGVEQNLPLTEVHKNIQKQWVDLIVDNYPKMLAVWEDLPNFERI